VNRGLTVLKCSDNFLGIYCSTFSWIIWFLFVTAHVPNSGHFLQLDMTKEFVDNFFGVLNEH
jgi:hypothetical protein